MWKCGVHFSPNVVQCYCQVKFRNLEFRDNLILWFRYLDYSHHMGKHIYVTGLPLMCAVCALLACLTNLSRPDEIQISGKKKQHVSASKNPQMPRTCSSVLHASEAFSSRAGLHLNFMNPCKGREEDHANTQFLVIVPLLQMQRNRLSC